MNFQLRSRPKLILRIKDPKRFLIPKKPEQFPCLTDEEYEFLLDDIENARLEGNEKYGYGGGLRTVNIFRVMEASE